MLADMKRSRQSLERSWKNVDGRGDGGGNNGEGKSVFLVRDYELIVKRIGRLVQWCVRHEWRQR